MGLASLAEKVVDGLTYAVHASREHAVEGEHLYLSGLFAPCKTELPPTALTVSAGALPASLNGLCVPRGARHGLAACAPR
jgi:hypothetical protein